jgi:hypothetical protein
MTAETWGWVGIYVTGIISFGGVTIYAVWAIKQMRDKE